MDTAIHLEGANIYQRETLVLSDINLDIKKGDFIYIIGTTGSGKSSLLKTLYGDLELRSGNGEVAGLKLKGLKVKQLPYLRRKLGIVFQDFQLLMDRSVQDNLIFALKATGWKDDKKIKEKIEQILDLVNLKTKHFKMPHQLSGGEQQRVVIARALLNNPEVILADEPTGNLDPQTSDDIIRLLFEINREMNTPIIVATHDYSIIEKYPAQIYKCVNGKLVKDEHMELS